jgi:predicted metal-binding membrane protein
MSSQHTQVGRDLLTAKQSLAPNPRVLSGKLRVYATAFIVFAMGAISTAYFSTTMRGAMPMPGGWTMSMVWMPMGAWTASLLMFSIMWVAMMVAMMLPSTLPIILLFRRVALFRDEPYVGTLCTVLAAGYFLAWAGFGLAAYGVGIGITQLAMRSLQVSYAVPFAAALALMAAGVFQLTPMKQACLRHCRDPLLLLSNHTGRGWRAALRLGLCHGAFCVACCWALMLIQLVLGVMNVAVMAVLAMVIAMEKLLPHGATLARVVGTLSLVGGTVQIVYLLLFR